MMADLVQFLLNIYHHLTLTEEEIHWMQIHWRVPITLFICLLSLVTVIVVQNWEDLTEDFYRNNP
jgi:hypothetical protein